MHGPTSWRFLNVNGELSQIGWQDTQRSKLWRYNQHYFEDLNADHAKDRQDWHTKLVHLWIEQNPPASGIGWEPYPTSIRIVNWIKWAMCGQILTTSMRRSLAIQTRWLARHLEWHLLGNHLFANAKALVHAGLYFEGPEAESWLRQGMKILAQEIPEQVLPDGGQFELSPMYHALALEDMLDLVNIAVAHSAAITQETQTKLIEGCRHVIPKMLRWLTATSHPDGSISFFNDAAFGIAPENSALIDYAQRLGFVVPTLERDGIIDLQDSGMLRLTAGPAVVLVDFAAIGPDYLPGHAHADTLSFEMSLYGQRLFVNSGTSVYGLGVERHRQRSTPAHNTVTVSGRSSSEVWSGFRVGARARVNNRTVSEQNHALFATASHNGYANFIKGLHHCRSLRLTQDSLTISDRLSQRAPAEARYHLHPSAQVELFGDAAGCIVLANGQKVTFSVIDGIIRIEQTTWHPEFGISQKNSCLVINLDSQNACLSVQWN